MQNLLHKVMNLPNEDNFKVIGNLDQLNEEDKPEEETKVEEQKPEDKPEEETEDKPEEETEDKSEDKSEDKPEEETKVEEQKPEEESSSDIEEPENNKPKTTSQDIPGTIPNTTFQKMDNTIDALIDNSGKSSYSKIFFERMQDISNIIENALLDKPNSKVEDEDAEEPAESKSTETEVNLEDGNGEQ